MKYHHFNATTDELDHCHALLQGNSSNRRRPSPLFVIFAIFSGHLHSFLQQELKYMNRSLWRTIEKYKLGKLLSCLLTYLQITNLGIDPEYSISDNREHIIKQERITMIMQWPKSYDKYPFSFLLKRHNDQRLIIW